MREILFRGKSKAVGSEWLYGDALIYEKSAQIWETINDRKHNSVVSIETIGQYIGLKDCKGTKIFEGDIVKFGDIIGVINYGFGCFCVKTNKPDWKSRNNPAVDIVFNEYPNEVEIIGNIHDNPELLRTPKNDEVRE